MIPSEETQFTKNSLVSIIIPVYNVGAYISQCLESVVCQTYQNIEIIVIDDGSTDDGGKICDEYAQKYQRIQVIHTENRGLSSARSLGLEQAKGTYISFVDSDDWIEPNTIEEMLGIALQTDSEVVVSNICFEYKGKLLERAHSVEQLNHQVLQGEKIIEAYIGGHLHDVVWNKLYHVSCLPYLHFIDIRFYEDVFITCGLMKHLAETDGKITVLPGVFFHQRMRKGSISHSRSLNVIADCWRAYCWKYKSLPEYKPQLIPGCIGAIGKMWPNYGGFSEEEKLRAKVIVQEMHSFSKARFYQIIAGNYSRYIKTVCLISQFKASLFMWLIYQVSNLLRKTVKTKETMYD